MKDVIIRVLGREHDVTGNFFLNSTVHRLQPFESLSKFIGIEILLVYLKYLLKKKKVT